MSTDGTPQQGSDIAPSDGSNTQAPSDGLNTDGSNVAPSTPSDGSNTPPSASDGSNTQNAPSDGSNTTNAPADTTQNQNTGENAQPAANPALPAAFVKRINDKLDKKLAPLMANGDTATLQKVYENILSKISQKKKLFKYKKYAKVFDVISAVIQQRLDDLNNQDSSTSDGLSDVLPDTSSDGSGTTSDGSGDTSTAPSTDNSGATPATDNSGSTPADTSGNGQ